MHDSQRRDALRPLVERLAQLLGTADGARISALLQDIELFWRAMRIDEEDEPEGAAPAVVRRPASRRIGIWRETDPETLVREPYSEAWHRFADVAVIPPKGERKRVLLLGESVARGYLYDPVLTFAGVIESYLQQINDSVEVVDLASTGANAAALANMLDGCDVLRPDALVVFAGNNWVLDPMPALFRRRFLNTWIAEGAAAARQLFLDELLPERVDETLDECVDAAQRLGVPLLFVLPEFNLADFIDYTDSMVPALDAGGPAAWLRLRDAANQALAQGEVERCEAHAAEMLRLDHGVHPTAYHLLARCALAQGASERAHQLLGSARDAQCGLPVSFAPRCPTLVHEAIRERSREDGFDLVDLPRLFSARGQIPGRELFLDYCHLSLQGMKRAGQEVAARLASALGEQDIQAGDIDTESVEMAPIHEATAHFLAGVHNAQTGAPMDLVSYQLDEALRICPRVRQLMVDFLDFRNRRKPDWMCASFDAACESPVVRRYLSSRPLPWQETIGDVPLFRALAQALERHGLEATEGVDTLRRKEAEHLPARVNVLECHRAPVLRMTLRHSVFLQCYHQQSRFYLDLCEAAPVVLRATWRVAAGQPEAPVTVELNGRQVAAAQVHSRWSSVSIEIDASLVRAGTNDIVLHWPRGRGAPANPRCLELDGGRGMPPRIFHAFGEIQRLVAELPGSPRAVTAGAAADRGSAPSGSGR